VNGSALPAVRVEINPLSLSKYGIGLQDVRAAISNSKNFSGSHERTAELLPAMGSASKDLTSVVIRNLQIQDCWVDRRFHAHRGGGV
jgi:multidrug efflux pump subunit AcrB